MGVSGGVHAQLPDLAGQGGRVPRRPGGQAALAASGVGDLATPTLAAGETWRDVAGFTPDIATLAARGLAYEHLDQLALEHLYGVR